MTAKRAAGYFSADPQPDADQLRVARGRGLDD